MGLMVPRNEWGMDVVEIMAENLPASAVLLEKAVRTRQNEIMRVCSVLRLIAAKKEQEKAAK